MLDQIIPHNLFAFFLVFARIGSVMILMPGFGEAFVPTRVRHAVRPADRTIAVTLDRTQGNLLS